MTAVREATEAPAITTEMPSGRTTGWWGMVLFVTTEATFFAAALGSYFYIRFQSGPQWPPPPLEDPKLMKVWVMTAVLLPSSLPVMWAEHGIRKGQRWRLRAGLSLTLLMGLTFLGLQMREYHDVGFTPETGAFASTFFCLTGLHGTHVLVGATLLAIAFVRSLRGHYSVEHHMGVELTGIYWHFVDLVWVILFTTVYIL